MEEPDVKIILKLAKKATGINHCHIKVTMEEYGGVSEFITTMHAQEYLGILSRQTRDLITPDEFAKLKCFAIYVRSNHPSDGPYGTSVAQDVFDMVRWKAYWPKTYRNISILYGLSNGGSFVKQWYQQITNPDRVYESPLDLLLDLVGLPRAGIG